MRVVTLSLCLAVFLTLGSLGHAQQSYGNSGTPANGISVPVSYGFINANNGNLHLEVPLVSKPTRGAVPFAAKLVYDSSNVYVVSNGAWVPATGTNFYGGWTLRTSADAPIIGQDPNMTQLCNDSNGHPIAATVWTSGFFIYDNNGTYHHFPLGITWQTCNVQITSFNGGVFADDGSGYYMQKVISSSGQSTTVWNRSGIQVYPVVQDTNGNAYGINASGAITDPTGATPFLISSPSGSEVDYTYYDSSAPGHQSAIKVGLANVSVCTDFTDGRTAYCNNTLKVVSSITFASGQAISFTYAANGGLQKITLPQGGADSFGETQLKYTSRSLNGSSWQISTNGSTITVTRPSETGDLYSARSVYTVTPLAGTNWQSQVQYYNPDGSLAMTTQTSWVSTCGGVQTGCVRPTQTVTTPAGGSATTIQYGYDSYYNVNSQKQWDFGVATTGTPISDIENVYATLTNPHIVDHPSSVTVNGNTGWGTTGQAAQTQYTYDGNGNLKTLKKWKNDDGSLVGFTYGYDAFGNRTSITDAMTNLTSITYGCSNSYPATVTRPSTGFPHVSSTSIDCNTGLTLSNTDENLQVTSFTYDVANRVSKVTLPGGGEKDYSYPSSTVSQSTVQNGVNSVVSTTALDQFGRISQQTTNDPEGNDTVTTSYDHNSRVSCVTNPQRSTGSSTDGNVCYSHDGLDRVTKATFSDGNAATAQFAGACETDTDPAGRPNQRCSDALGHLIQVQEPNESTGALAYTTLYTYDVLGHLLSVQQKGNSSSNWRPRTFRYNSLSGPTSVAMPETGTTTFDSYDANGNLLQQTDARGTKTYLAYDALNRVTSKTFSDTATKPVSIHYDESSVWTHTLGSPIGRVTSIYRGRTMISATVYSYDAMGRVTQQWDCRPSNCGTSAFLTQYGYDQAGNLTSLTYPSGRVVTYGYSAANAPTSVTLSKYGSTSINFPYVSISTHYPNGSPSAITFGNGVTETISVNGRGERTKDVLSGTQTWLNRNFGYSNPSAKNDGNLWSVTDNLRSGGNQSFSYDYLNRVTSASQSDGTFSETFTYDPWGNMQQAGTASFSPAEDSNNRVNFAGFTYDAAGNMTAEGTTNHAFTYDAENHVASVDATAASYTYGASGLRERKDIGSTHVEYIYNGHTVIAEQNETSDWTDYVMTPGGRTIKAEGLDKGLHIYGTNCSSCGSQYTLFYFPGAGGLSGYTIQTGDKLFLTQYQKSGSKGGIVVAFTDGTNTSWNAKDQDGYYANDDQNQAATHLRTIDLSSFAGKTINNVALNSESDTAAGSWAIIYEQAAFVTVDGRVQPLYTGQSSSPLQAGTGSSGVTNRGFTIDVNHNKAQYPNTSTTYYHTDGVGTARLITQGSGWPVWQGTFAPFGQEITPQISVDNNKFATYQHETESGLEHAGFRKYSSIQGRFMSPDPDSESANPTNPQSWNRYTYVQNDPLVYVDPDGTTTDCFGWSSHCGSGSLSGYMAADMASIQAGIDVSGPGGFAAAAEAAYSPFVFEFQGTLFGKSYDQTFSTWDQYASWRTGIAALPESQVYMALMASCQYMAQCDSSQQTTVLSQQRGFTQNIQILGPDGNPLALNVDAVTADAGHVGHGHGGNESWYIGGMYDVLHVVDVVHPYAGATIGGEAHVDEFSPYGLGVPLHAIDYVSSFLPNGTPTTYTCSAVGGCN
jgi:RHS repeat-associated protein